MLVSHKRIDVNTPDASGCTPLWLASQNGHLSIVQHLFASGREIDTKVKAAFNNKTAVEQARGMSSRVRKEGDDDEDKFQRRKVNCPLIVVLIDSYDKDPSAVRVQLRKQLGFGDPKPSSDPKRPSRVETPGFPAAPGLFATPAPAPGLITTPAPGPVIIPKKEKEKEKDEIEPIRMGMQRLPGPGHHHSNPISKGTPSPLPSPSPSPHLPPSPATPSSSKHPKKWKNAEVVSWLAREEHDKLSEIAAGEDWNGMSLFALFSVRLDPVAYKNDCVTLGITTGALQVQFKGILVDLFQETL